MKIANLITLFISLQLLLACYCYSNFRSNDRLSCKIFSATVLHLAKKTSNNAKNTASPPPPRVTNQLNVPIRHQIAYAKMLKQSANQNANKHVGKSVLNIKKKEKEVYNETVDFDSFDYNSLLPPIVFIDGYNLIFYLYGVSRIHRSLEDVREELINDVCSLARLNDWQVELVFDAYKTGRPEKKEQYGNVLIVYTSVKETADNYIERRFYEIEKEGNNRTAIVATNDVGLRTSTTNFNSTKLSYMSAEMIREEISIARQSWELQMNRLESPFTYQSGRTPPKTTGSTGLAPPQTPGLFGQTPSQTSELAEMIKAKVEAANANSTDSSQGKKPRKPKWISIF